MTSLAKFTLKSGKKPPTNDPVQQRRDKLIAAIGQQKLVCLPQSKARRICWR